MIDYLIKQAVEQHSPISIIYKKNDSFSHRKIKVIKLKDDTIWAYCYYRQDYRQFKIQNILSVAKTTESYYLT